jgi:hypothetical protein
MSQVWEPKEVEGVQHPYTASVSLTSLQLAHAPCS